MKSPVYQHIPRKFHMNNSSIYHPLPSSSSIRLLEIEPGVPLDEQITCRLIQVPALHRDCPTFEALSYVWGSLVKSKRITCNDHPNFAITQSLYDALGRLRLPHRSRRVWADAICINQDDVDERGQQVRIMRDIYAAASKVCVWVGPDTESDGGGEAERASTLMTVIAQTCEVSARTPGKKWDDMSTEERFQCADLPTLGVYGDMIGRVTDQRSVSSESESGSESVVLHWKALRNFYARPWFTRVWCVQEIVVAQDSVVMCGDVDIPWRVVELTATWLNTQQIHHDFNVPPLIEDIDAFSALMMCEASDPLLRSNTLTGALRTFQDFRATDPRDKVYAILGITGDDQLAGRVPISYEKSVVQVYIGVVEATLDVQKDLLVIACAQHPDTFAPDPSFPSWVPRWDCMVSEATMITLDIGVDDNDWKASDSRKLDEFKIDPNNGTLSLKGVVFDTVDFVSDKMDYKDFDSSSSRLSSSSSSNPSIILSLWRRLIDPHTTSTAGIMRIMNFASTLTCELDVNNDVHVMDIDDPADRDIFFTDFLAYIMHLHDLEDEKNPRPTMGEEETKDTRPHTFPSLTGDWKRYETAASRMCDQRRFFTTKRGYMGLGPASARDGDEVVVLFGGRVPFMLRKVVASRGECCQARNDKTCSCYHYLLGECFVQDVMRGEVIDVLEEGPKGENKEEFVEREFRIR